MLAYIAMKNQVFGKVDLNSCKTVFVCVCVHARLHMHNLVRGHITQMAMAEAINILHTTTQMLELISSTKIISVDNMYLDEDIVTN